MTRAIFWLATSLLFGAFSTNCWGKGESGLYLEPFVGFASINYDDNDGDDSDDWKGGGMGYGGRVGWNFNGLTLGGVYDTSGTEAENKAIAQNKTDMDFTATGIFLGYQTDSGFRFWGTYFLNTKMEWSNFQWSDPAVQAVWEAIYGPGAIEFTGDGIGIGLGYTFFDTVSVFAELHNYSYDKFKASGGLFGTQERSLTGDAGSSFWFLGVSIPFTI